MANPHYDPRYAAGQQGQGYYPNQGQRLPNTQGYPMYPSHGVQTFQNNGYLPQAQQAPYPPQSFPYQQPLHNNNAYQYNAPMNPQHMMYRTQPQSAGAPQLQQDQVSYPHRLSQDMRPHIHQSQIPSPQMRMPTQSPVQQQQFAPRPSQSPFQPQRPSTHVQMKVSPVQQLQLPLPQTQTHDSQVQNQPQTISRIPETHSTVVQPHTQLQPQALPQARPQFQHQPPAAQRKPSHAILQQHQNPMPSPKQSPNPVLQQHQSSMPSPKQSSKPVQQPPPSVPRTTKPLQQQKPPTSVKAARPPSSHSHQASTASIGRPASQSGHALSEELALTVAEEYLEAAAKLKKDSGRDHPTDEYFQLITIGLRTLKSVLTNMRPKPPVEAAIRLRYASMLFEETAEDYMPIEEILSTGITVCERNRLYDAKYHMVHLLVRCMFVNKPKAALKYLDTGIRDVETTRHVAWIYAFRFLRASLSMQLKQHQEVINAIAQLKLVTEKAAERGDRIVSTLAAAMEAHIHISRNNTPDSIEQAQRALATARSLQQTTEAKTVPQLMIMVGFIDVGCSMYQADTNQALTKMNVVQGELDALINSAIWSSDGYFDAPLGGEEHNSAPGSDMRTSGVIHRNEQGDLSLCVKWLDKEQIYGMSFLLNAVTRHHKNASDEKNKSEKLLQEAQAMFEASDAREPSEQNEYARRALHVLLLTTRVFEQCSRNRWADAKSILQKLNQQLKDLPEVPGAPWQALSHYLDGVTQQATGNMETALKAYSHESLSLPQGNEYRTPYQRELALLATMNSLLIIRTPGHPLHSTYASMLSTLEPLANASTNRNIFSAHNFVRAAMPDLQATTSILDTKAFLQTALQAAKQTCNNQLMCITLNILSYKFFKGVVGDQAEKSGKATQTLARKGKDSLWLSVADGALAETLRNQGKEVEAQNAWKEAVDLAGRLPKNMRGVVEDGKQDDMATEPMALTDQFAM